MERLKGIISGYPDGTFKPDAPVTRAELAKKLHYWHLICRKKSALSYGDVEAENWYYPYLEYSAEYIPCLCASPHLTKQIFHIRK